MSSRIEQAFRGGANQAISKPVDNHKGTKCTKKLTVCYRRGRFKTCPLGRWNKNRVGRVLGQPLLTALSIFVPLLELSRIAVG